MEASVVIERCVSTDKAIAFIDELKNPNIKEPRIWKELVDNSFEIDFPFFKTKIVVLPEDKNIFTRVIRIERATNSSFDNEKFVEIFLEYLNN